MEAISCLCGGTYRKMQIQSKQLQAGYTAEIAFEFSHSLQLFRSLRRYNNSSLFPCFPQT